MKIIIVVVLLSITQAVVAQKKSDLITLRIDRDTLNYNKSKKSLLVPFTFSNNLKEDIITYALSVTPDPVPFELNDLCEIKGTGTGIAFAVYRLDGKQEKYQFTISDDFSRKPVTRKVFDSIFRASNERFLQTKKVISKKSSASFEKEVFLEDFLLEPGEYFLQIAYYCGENIFTVVDAEEIKKNGARLFQGCVMSNKIKFFVK